MVLVQQAYGTLESNTANVRQRRFRPTAAAALVAIAVVALGCLVFNGRWSQERFELVDDESLAGRLHYPRRNSRAGAAGAGKAGKGQINTYPDWLKTLNKDPQWANEDDQQQQAHLANSAIPFSKRIGSLQGVDFAKDAYQPNLTGGGTSPWEAIPVKLEKFKATVKAEEVVYKKLKKILDDHAKPDPQALVVHVAERGPVGPQGPRGTRGTPGDQGPAGPVGPPGPPGDEGPRGPRGAIGPTGLKGFPGAVGKRGFEGRVGKRGTMGPEGAKGKKGWPGMPGDAGPPGPQGANGDRGQEGPRGPKGANGEPGAGIVKFLISKLNVDSAQ